MAFRAYFFALSICQGLNTLDYNWPGYSIIPTEQETYTKNLEVQTF